MSTITAGIQAFSIPGYIAIVVIAAVLWRRAPAIRGLLIMPAIWGMYGVVFYVLVLASAFTEEAYLLWGAIHRFLAMIMVLGALVAALIMVFDELNADTYYEDSPEDDDG